MNPFNVGSILFYFVLIKLLYIEFKYNIMDIAERNKSNYLKAKDAFNRHNLEECIRYYNLNHEVKSSPSKKGRTEIQGFLESILKTWPDIQIKVENVLASGDFVMARSIATASHSNIVLGVNPTHKRVVAAFWDLHRFNTDGTIIETWNLMDNLTIMKQLGIFPSSKENDKG